MRWPKDDIFDFQKGVVAHMLQVAQGVQKDDIFDLLKANQRLTKRLTKRLVKGSLNAHEKLTKSSLKAH